MAAEAVAPTGDADKDKRMQKLCVRNAGRRLADAASESLTLPLSYRPRLAASRRRSRSLRRTRRGG